MSRPSAKQRSGERGPPPGSVPGKSITLRRALVAVLTLAMQPVIVPAVVRYLKERRMLETLKGQQSQIQRIEERVRGLPTANARAQHDGERRYFDPVNGAHVATDAWIQGLLVRRSFYASGRLVARDEFRYDSDVPIEKTRFYLDNDQRIFLIDHFVQDGMLRQKRHCPSGPENPCRVRMMEMRSPLPPPWLMVYR